MLLPAEIPLFPLPGVTLFPDLPLPLHIFEPRYRAMVRDALAGDKTIGIVQVKPGASGSPTPIFRIGCAGTIDAHAPLPGGRSNIVLRGVSRFRIEAELDAGDLPYRRARVTSLVEVIRDEEALTQALARVLHEIGQIDEGMTLLARNDEAPKALVVNMLSQLLPLGDLERQSLLEAETLEGRAHLLGQILEFTRLAKTAPPRQDTQH